MFDPNKVLSLVISVALLSSCAKKGSIAEPAPVDKRSENEVKIMSAYEELVSRPGCEVRLESPTIETVPEDLKSRFSDRQFLSFKFSGGRSEIVNHFITCIGAGPPKCRTSRSEVLNLAYAVSVAGLVITNQQGVPEALLTYQAGKPTASLVALSSGFKSVLQAMAVTELELKIHRCKSK